jgi:DNA helicase-2/ATP-dependent DNA helicase PcrA
MPFTKAFAAASTVEGIPDAARVSLRKLKELLDGAAAAVNRDGSLHSAAAELVERIELRRALDDSAEGGKQGDFRYQNVLHLLNWIERFETNAPRDRKSLTDFLQRVTLQGDTPEVDEADGQGVTLCTLHAAKGLEFGVVFLIGCVEGQLPHSRTTDPKENAATEADLEEERRLFYVGITRAQDRLYLIAPRRRVLRGKTVEIAPSRYLEGLPDEHIREYERPEEQEMSVAELSSAARSLRELLQKNQRTAPTSR